MFALVLAENPLEHGEHGLYNRAHVVAFRNLPHLPRTHLTCLEGIRVGLSGRRSTLAELFFHTQLSYALFPSHQWGSRGGDEPHSTRTTPLSEKFEAEY